MGTSTKRIGMVPIAVVRGLNLDKRDCTGIAGISTFGAGAWAIFWPAGLIAIGVVLLYVAHGGVNGILKRGNGTGSDDGASGQQ